MDNIARRSSRMDNIGRTRPRMRVITRMGLVLLAFAALWVTTPAFALRASTSYWKNPQNRALLYWIDAKSFPDPAELEALRANLTKAMGDWQNICLECGIRFIEVVNRTDAIFRVVSVDVRRAFMANGFNPSDPPEKWMLQIDRSYFNQKSKFDKVGVLRHELGHILGYRHEQISAPPDQFVKCGWKTETNTDDKSVISLTEYDPQSLMHYPCGVATNIVMFNFSPKDIAGHRKLYGPKVASPVVSAAETPAPQTEGADSAGRRSQ